jgi:hypothetical protein
MIFNRDNRIPAWQVARQDPEKFRHSKAVGKIVNKRTGSTGTAFRIGSGNRVMTNAHVLSSGNPRDYRIEFTDDHGRVTSVDGDRLLAFSTRPGQRNPRPEIRNRPNLDFALFTIAPSQFESVKRFGHLELDVEGAKPGQRMYIPQYSVIETPTDTQTPKTIVISDDFQGPGQSSRIDRVYRDSDVDAWYHNQTVQFTADTKPGSSGSPVISSDSHKVVALNNGQNWNWTNAATNMSSIWQQIKGFFSNSASDRPLRTQQHGANQSENKRQYGVGDRRNYNGTLQEFWKNPSGGQKWVDVWQPKDYAVGTLVVSDGKAYAYLGRNQQGASQWASVFDPGLRYQPNSPVYYYGRIVDANQLIADLSNPRRNIY